MYNLFIGAGNLAADPDVKTTANGTQVATFTVCCDSGWGDKKHTEFVRCVAWAKTAELAGQYLSKGSKVLIQGEMKTRTWDDKDGNKRYQTEIVVSTLKFLSSKSDPGSKYEPAGMNTGDDLPF
jgi:single-strand DNA-binding protein